MYFIVFETSIKADYFFYFFSRVNELYESDQHNTVKDRHDRHHSCRSIPINFPPLISPGFLLFPHVSYILYYMLVSLVSSTLISNN